jgi:hypothetical protein
MALGLSLYATALADSFFQPGGITPVFCRSRTFRSEVAKFVRLRKRRSVGSWLLVVIMAGLDDAHHSHCASAMDW